MRGELEDAVVVGRRPRDRAAAACEPIHEQVTEVKADLGRDPQIDPARELVPRPFRQVRRHVVDRRRGPVAVEPGAHHDALGHGDLRPEADAVRVAERLVDHHVDTLTVHRQGVEQFPPGELIVEEDLHPLRRLERHARDHLVRHGHGRLDGLASQLLPCREQPGQRRIVARACRNLRGLERTVVDGPALTLQVPQAERQPIRGLGEDANVEPVVPGIALHHHVGEVGSHRNTKLPEGQSGAGHGLARQVQPLTQFHVLVRDVDAAANRHAVVQFECHGGLHVDGLDHALVAQETGHRLARPVRGQAVGREDAHPDRHTLVERLREEQVRNRVPLDVQVGDVPRGARRVIGARADQGGA